MEYEEAIERLKKRICQEGVYREDKTYHFCTDGCMCGEECCAISLAIKALEKQIPKKINIIKEVLNAVCCPNCHYCLGDIEVRRRYKTEYKCCPNCGQHIDWSDKK